MYLPAPNADVLSASYNDGKIAWYESNGAGSFTTHIVTTSLSQATQVFPADVDNDGDLDVLCSHHFAVSYYANDGSGGFSSRREIYYTGGAVGSIYAADVDGDGDMDVLSASYDTDTIAWDENNGSENFTAHTITTAADGAWRIRQNSHRHVTPISASRY
jgi:hypothetical protein